MTRIMKEHCEVLLERESTCYKGVCYINNSWSDNLIPFKTFTIYSIRNLLKMQVAASSFILNISTSLMERNYEI